MSIRTRLLMLLILIPMALLLLFSLTTLHHFDQQRRATLEAHLTGSVALLAPSLLHAIDTEQHAELRELASRLMAINAVRAISIDDGEGTTWLQLGEPLRYPPPPPAHEQDNRWRLVVPLGPTPDSFRLNMTVDTTSLTLRHYRALVIFGLVWLITGLCLFLFAYWITQRIFNPLDNIRDLVRRLNIGDYRRRLDTSGPYELSRLSSGINALADRLESAHEDMQQHIEQTTRDLQESMDTIEAKNIELDMAHRRALEASRIKSEFLANMSHEIRTPLNGIIGFCQLLGRSPLDARQREWLSHVSKASDSLLSLINGILDFSKLEAGKMQLENLNLDMVALVDEVLGLQAPHAHQKSLYLLGLVYDDVPTTLQGDPLRIKQILTNLVHNAIKFTERGEVIVRVMVEEEHGDSTILKVTVSDTGVGLSPSDRERLFTAFSQVGPDSRRRGGTGLGLMICRQLVEQMGGWIGVESQLGQGSVFSFTLPLVRSAIQARPLGIALDDVKIALYEPHQATRNALRHLLSDWGAELSLFDDASPSADSDLLIAGLAHDDLHPERLAHWQTCLGSISCPSLVLVNASPLELPPLSLPNGGEILTHPLARQTLIDALINLLAPAPRQTLPAPRPTPLPQAHQVLVVDDTPSNRILLEQLLTDLGISSRSCNSGEEALALAQSEAFDLVLMDIRLPGMDGVATTAALRSLGGRWRECPVIAVTAHILDEERRQLHTQGFQSVLIKPVDHAELAEQLHRHLSPLPPLRKLPEPLAHDEPARGDATFQHELPVVDMALGTRLAADREDLARETLILLLDSLTASEEALRGAWERQDEEAFLDAIHALNGACRYCGVPQLALIAETLETRLRTRGLAGTEPLLDALYGAMSRLREWQGQHADFLRR